MERATQIVIELLAKGCTQVEVASLTGNSESAISQVATKYASQIVDKQGDVELASSNHSQKLDRLESLAASKLEGMIALETDTLKVLKILKDVNAAVRRGQGESGGSSPSTQVNVVNLNMPKHLQQHIEVVTNMQNDVVAVGGRDLTPASIKSVNALAGIKQGEDQNEVLRTQALDDILSAPIPRYQKGSAEREINSSDR